MQRTFSSFEQGDIVIAVVPFSDQTGEKRRPVLVLSGSEYLKDSQDVTILQITSKQNSGKFRVAISQNDLEKGHLKTESEIKVDSPATLHKALIERHIGKINEQKLVEVKKATGELYEL